MHCPECDIHSAKTIRITVEKFNWWMIRVWRGLCTFIGIAVLFTLWNVGTVSATGGRFMCVWGTLAVGIAACLEVGMRAGRK